MTAAARVRSRRVLGVLLAGACAGALVAGCAAGSGQTASGSTVASSSTSSSVSSTSASSSSAGASQSPLSKGLLPAAAFGANTTVVDLTLEQLQKTTGGQLGSASDLQVQPPQCQAVLKGSQVDPTQVKDLVGKSATSQSGAGQQTITLEALMTGDAASGAVDKLKSTLADCSHVTATSPQIGQASVQFTPIDVSGIGAQAAAAAYTTTLTRPGHPTVTVPALIGVVQDRDRLVLLITANADAASVNGGPAAPAPDQNAFTGLLKQAYTTEHQALG